MKALDFRVPGTKLPFIEKWVEVGYTEISLEQFNRMVQSKQEDLVPVI